MNNLKTIDQHNEIVWKQMMEARGTGVACPKCDDGFSEMVWADDVVLASYPSQRNVVCSICNHKDRIYV